MGENLFSITPAIQELTELCIKNDKMDVSLYEKYNVKRGLRSLNGKGVLAGLTNIADVHGKEVVDGQEVPLKENFTIEDMTWRSWFRGL